MIETPEQAAAIIDGLGFPEVFASLWSNTVPEDLRWICVEPRRYFRIRNELVLLFPDAAGILPLWEENLESLVCLSEKGHYIRLVYAPDENRDMLGLSYQAFMARFFLELMDSGLWTELEELASEFAFVHLPALARLAEQSDSQQGREALDRFLLQLDEQVEPDDPGQLWRRIRSEARQC